MTCPQTLEQAPVDVPKGTKEFRAQAHDLRAGLHGESEFSTPFLKDGKVSSERQLTHQPAQLLHLCLRRLTNLILALHQMQKNLESMVACSGTTTLLLEAGRSGMAPFLLQPPPHGLPVGLVPLLERNEILQGNQLHILQRNHTFRV